MRGTAFTETMLGTIRLDAKTRERRIRLDLHAEADGILRPHRTTPARLTGRVRIAGFADDPRAEGELEVSPLARRRIRYQLAFTADGRRLTLDGWKSVTARRPVESMTVLPFTLYEGDARVGEGVLRFPLATGLAPFLLSFRFPRRESSAEHFPPRWNGEPGRTEVWYTTLTDPASGTGVWLHHEVTAPADGSEPFAHGWVAAFPREGAVRHARFGPVPWTRPADGFAGDNVTVVPGELTGNAGDFHWKLTEHPQGEPLFTFPRWSWRRPLLPAAQMLPAARATYEGEFSYGEQALTLRGAPGASARIYGHGNAHRWTWLHAELGGGDVLEIVAAVSTRPGLRRLPPLVFLRLRRRGRTWPRRAERTALGWLGMGRFRAVFGLPKWTVTGRTAFRRIRVEVDQPAERTLTLEYRDPDGARAVCRNSESADARIVLERWWGRWRPEATWLLDGTAHAEAGER
ncbi:hypothetical protein GCM10011579_083330 [Streptomyces albiflavescens]|uniref:Uncharacterized protein n=1 Tax=Streptomyces albiflavescens TaxID=1623582 RepID=A0A917YDL8_9ACTN|nr:hypothetical protein [Streptomyces albiflavescens]GGN89022.1 hypothetical protein GCM10011579_083330 [Streptomyces albiflavescens]